MSGLNFMERGLEAGRNVSFHYSINAGLSVSEPGVVQNPESKLGHVGD